MTDSFEALLPYLTRGAGPAAEDSLLDQLRDVVLRSEAERLIEQLQHISAGNFEVTNPDQIIRIIQWLGSLKGDASWSVAISEPALTLFPAAVRNAFLQLIASVLEGGTTTFTGTVKVTSASILKVIEDPLLLRLALLAAGKGLYVSVVGETGSSIGTALEVVFSTNSGRVTVSTSDRNDTAGAVWSIQATTDIIPDLRSPVPDAANVAAFSLPQPFTFAGLARQHSVETDTDTSIVDLFGALICLRDLEPRSSQLRGLHALRTQLGIAAPFVPRKNEPDYATVVESFIKELAPDASEIIYIGDTVFNDGSVICNLDTKTPNPVFGFLCNEKGFGAATDFILGPVYFGQRWRSLPSFLAESRRRGMALDGRTVALFDLDQTVYAAKGRDDEALREARWEAIRAFLRDTIPAYKFDPVRSEEIYRQFDQDRYHRITRDNMDYVVLLVLAVATGLCDAREIEQFASSNDNSIASLTHLLHQRALSRLGHEEIEGVLEVIRAVHYNTLAGDQTPCKDFRRYECQATAHRMQKSSILEARGRIYLNREVTDFIHILKGRGVTAFAVSDRPIEAAVIADENGVTEDLMNIPLRTIGIPIDEALRKSVG